MLDDLITREMIQFSDKTLDWKEAIKLAARPLKDFGFIEPRYIEAMINKVEKYGAFIHIGKGIALPHARPEEGAKRVGMSVLKMSHPVLLLGQKEHPITVFICLSAVDNTMHLKALYYQQQTTILSDEHNLACLLNAQNDEEIISVLSEGAK